MKLELEVTDEMAKRLEMAGSSLALSIEDVTKVALSQYLTPPRKSTWEQVVEQLVFLKKYFSSACFRAPGEPHS